MICGQNRNICPISQFKMKNQVVGTIAGNPCVRLSVVFSLHNEEESAIPLAEDITAALAKLRGRFRLILIDGASGTAGHRNTDSIIASGEVSGIALESAGT